MLQVDSCLPQSQSSLFQLPAEIRDVIFRLALTETYDYGRFEIRNSYNYRPGYYYGTKIHTDLLLSCKRVYHEAALLPAQLNEHTFFFNRGPEWRATADNPLVYFKKMPLEQRQAVPKVIFFTQQYEMERPTFLNFTKWLHNWCPPAIKFVFRHSDWWWWEQGDALAIDPYTRGKATFLDPRRPVLSDRQRAMPDNAWGYMFHHLTGLQRLEIELESTNLKKLELEAIVDRAIKTWRFPIGDDRELVSDGSIQASQWVGYKPEPIGTLSQGPPSILYLKRILTFYSRPKEVESEVSMVS
jgi:hypothetical protein